MSSEIEPREAEWLRSLGTLPKPPALPDPDVLWLRAQLAARQEAAMRASWRSVLRGALGCGLVFAGALWLVVQLTTTEEWVALMAAMSAAPVYAAALAAAAALALAAVVGGLIFGRSLVASRLRHLGLL